jgi:butyryl-CoA dehydrogenase
MHDVRLTPDQAEFRDTVRDFVTQEVKPFALNPQRLEDFSRPFPGAMLDKASGMGLRTLALSEASGGAGADTLTSCVVMEELGAGDVDIAFPLAYTSILAPLLFDRAMTEEQRERFLPRFMEDDGYHLACAAHQSDPDLGWSYHRDVKAESGCRVKAARQGNGDWIVNGVTDLVPNAPIAKLIAVQAQIGADTESLITLLVPRDTAGCSIRDAQAPGSADDDGATVKWYHGAAGEISLKDCRVPANNVLRGDAGAQLSAASVAPGSPQFQAINLGVGRAAFEAAVEYAKLRVQGARPIIQHQAIGTILADIAVRLEVARNIIWHAARVRDHLQSGGGQGSTDLPVDTIAQVYTSEAMCKVTEDAAECFGAMGVMLDMPPPKYVRDARVFLHSGDSVAVAKLRIAEAVAGFSRTPH